MKKFLVFSIFLFAASSAGISAQSVKTIPQPVMDWYTDTVQIFSTLESDLSAAADATAAAKAFDTAASNVKTKDIAARFKKLKHDYPDLVDPDGKNKDGWVPPAGWVKIQADYAKKMQSFGTVIQTVMMNYGQDPRVQASVQKFGVIMAAMGGNDAEAPEQ